ncbi:MAG: aminodeoxychorismate lyase [Gammaproteobacteria bacterium]|nr:aminodeoxychorismate lyase [Gammaproteobacteria bacterium]
MRSANGLVLSLLNGEETQACSVEDRALHYGDGLFETMLMQSGKIKYWPLHLQRLLAGCQQLKINPPSSDELNKDLSKLANQLGKKDFIVKLIVSRGIGGRGLKVPQSLIATRLFLAYSYQDDPLKPAKQLKVCQTRLLENSTLGGIKHLNRLPYLLASEELEGFDEGIMLNSQSEVVECITHNIFGVKDGQLFTPMITNCGVKGIMRQQVIERAKRQNMKLSESAFNIKRWKEMDECFITNAVIGLQSVSRIDDHLFEQNHVIQQLNQDKI